MSNCLDVWYFSVDEINGSLLSNRVFITVTSKDVVWTVLTLSFSSIRTEDVLYCSV